MFNDTGYVQLDIPMADTVRYEGDTVRIKCEITGYPLPRYAWYKDDVIIDTSSPDNTRFNVRTTPWGSRYVQSS